MQIKNKYKQHRALLNSYNVRGGEEELKFEFGYMR